MLEGQTSGKINLSDIQGGKRKIWQENIEETLVGKKSYRGREYQPCDMQLESLQYKV